MLRKFAAIILTLVAVLAAGWFALKRPDIPYETLESSYTLPESQFLTVSGDIKLHYTDTGPRDAPVVVLVHGFAASLHTWQPWRKTLENSYRVITLDLPGHGLSRVSDEHPVSIDYYVDTVEAVTRKLKVDQFSLAGSSMGGNVAWQYALAHPDQLVSLILVDASGWPDANQGDDPLVFRLLRIPLARILMKDLDLSGLIEGGLRDSFANPDLVSQDMVERYTAMSRAPGHRDAMLRLMAGSNSRVKASKQRLADIRVPTLILWGKHDNLIPVGDAARFEAALPNAVAITYPDAGHIPQEEVADESASDVRAFLDRHAAVSPAMSTDAVATPVSETAQTGNATGGGLRPR